mgnify:FL=1
MLALNILLKYNVDSIYKSYNCPSVHINQHMYPCIITSASSHDLAVNKHNIDITTMEL